VAFSPLLLVFFTIPSHQVKKIRECNANSRADVSESRNRQMQEKYTRSYFLFCLHCDKNSSHNSSKSIIVNSDGKIPVLEQTAHLYGGSRGYCLKTKAFLLSLDKSSNWIELSLFIVKQKESRGIDSPFPSAFI
jgi:hypothetical protein